MTLKKFPESSETVEINNEEKEEEKKVRRIIDLRIIPTVAMLYLWCFIDRANIGNARLGTMEKTLGMNPKSYQFNILLTSFYCSYIVFEIPSTIMTKLVGPKIWIPFITFCYGLFSMSTGFCRFYHSAIVVRFLLGIAEAGMLPSVALYLSRFYKKDELALRLAFYIVTAPLAGAFGGLLASGILKIDHIGKFTNWEMIFLIEGLITIGLSFIGYFTMTDRIETANWLAECEKALAVKRLQMEMIGQSRLIDKANKRSIIRGILAPTSLMCALMFLFTNITVQGIAFFLPTIIRSLYPHKSIIHQQLLTVPPNVLGAFGVLVSAFVSTRYRTRFPVVFVNSIFMATGYLLFLTSSNLNVRYAGCFITCLGAYSMGALLPAWASINTNNDSERVGAIGVVIMFGNVGGLIATWSYLPKHKPDYIPGNALNLAAGIGIGLLSTFLFIWQRRQNTKRQRGDNDHLMEDKTDEEIEKLGLRHPGFRFKY